MFNKRIQINFICNLLYQMSLLLLPLLISPYLTRALGAEPLGRYQYANTVTSYFCIFCILGIATYGNRECAIVRDDRDRLSEAFWGIYGVQLIASLIVIGIYLGYLYLGRLEDLRMGIFQIPYLLSYMLDITWLYYGLEYFYKISLRNFLIKIFSMAFIFLLVKKSEDVYIYCLIMTGTTLLSQAVLWPGAVRLVGRPRIRMKCMKKHIPQILLLFLPVVGISVYAGIDKIMIGNIIGKSAVAVYSYSENLAKLPVGIVTALTTVMLPYMSKMAAEHRMEEGRAYIRNTMRVTMFLALPIAAGIAGIADTMIPWFYADDFLECIPLVKMLVVIIVFIAWTYVVQNQCLIPMHKDTVLVKSAVLTAVLNVGANLLLIPLFGIYGAALGTILSELLVMCYKTWHCREAAPVLQMIRDNAGVLALALAMYACVHLAGVGREAVLKTTLLQIAVGIVVYGGGCLGVLAGIWIWKKRIEAMHVINEYRNRICRLLEKYSYAYLILCFYGLTFLIRYSLGMSLTLMSLSVYGLIVLKILCTNYSKREILMGIVLVVVAGMNYRRTGDSTWIINMLVIFSMKGVRVEKILKGMFWASLVSFLAVTLTSAFGAGDVAVVTKDYGRGALESRYCLGYGHANQLHLYFFRVLILGVGAYFERLKWYHVLAATGLNILLYYFTVSRTGVMIVLLLIVFWILYRYMQKLGESKAWRLLLFGGVAALILFQLTYIYFYDGNVLLYKINSLLTGRLELSGAALRDCPLTLWGMNYVSDFSVDIGVIHMLIFNGLVITVFYWGMTLLGLWKGLQEKNAYKVIVIVLFAVYALAEYSAVERIGRNVSMMYFAGALFERKNRAGFL